MMKLKQATPLMSRELHRPLTWSERVGLRTHLLMCSGCSNFRKQMTFMHEAARRWRE